jgi:CheY-like chemotaxis protein
MNIDTSTEGQFSVLIIDDDSALRRLVRMRLQAEGYLILEAASGEEGLLTFEMYHPDLVLIDVMMNGIRMAPGHQCSC